MQLEPSDWGFDYYLRFNGSGIYWNTQEKGKTYMLNGVKTALKDKEYMPDVMHNKMVEFMTQNKNKPFFAYYSLSHVHGEILPTPDSKADSKNIYDDNIRYMDKLVGQLREELVRLKLDKNTILVFFGDNGTAKPNADAATIGGRRLIGQKGSMQEGGALVPMLVYWPGVTPKGKVSNDLISAVDFLPTFAEIAGVQLPTDKIFDGQSFNAQLYGQKGNPRSSIFIQLARNWYARNSEFKLNQKGELYDMSKAPFEEILVPTDSQEPKALAARKSLQAELDRLNPQGGFIDTGDESGRHASNVNKKGKKDKKEDE
jgi:arylsulfatase A